MAKKPPKARTRTGLAATPTGGDAGSIDFPILIIAGVSGSGKTTVATALAQRLSLPFEEGDQLHPRPHFAKIHSAHPLDDREQWSWLEKIVAWINDCQQLGTGGVITCPALRRSHRDFLTLGRPDVYIVYLHGERALIASRLVAHEPIDGPKRDYGRRKCEQLLRCESDVEDQELAHDGEHRNQDHSTDLDDAVMPLSRY